MSHHEVETTPEQNARRQIRAKALRDAADYFRTCKLFFGKMDRQYVVARLEQMAETDYE
jgi:hypothetical protein